MVTPTLPCLPTCFYLGLCYMLPKAVLVCTCFMLPAHVLVPCKLTMLHEHDCDVTIQGKVDDHRRKWDRSEFEKLARERLAAEEREVKSSSSRDVGRREPPVKRDLLKPREYKVFLFFMLYTYYKETTFHLNVFPSI